MRLCQLEVFVGYLAWRKLRVLVMAGATCYSTEARRVAVVLRHVANMQAWHQPEGQCCAIIAEGYITQPMAPCTETSHSAMQQRSVVVPSWIRVPEIFSS